MNTENNNSNNKNKNITPILFNKDNNIYKSQEKKKDEEINIISDNRKDSNEKKNIENEILNTSIKFDPDLNPQKQNNNDNMKNGEFPEISEDNEKNEINNLEIKETDQQKENIESINNNMTIEIANEVIYRLIKYNPYFKSFEEFKEMNDYVHLTSSNSIYPLDQIELSKHSYYKIKPEEPEDILDSSSSFDISPRAKEFGIKLKGLIESGEVVIYANDPEMLIVINIFKICNYTNETKGSIIINIEFPKERYPPQDYNLKSDEVFEIAGKITYGFKLGIKYAAAAILECVIKKGITYILAGPICAAIGFSD